MQFIVYTESEVALLRRGLVFGTQHSDVDGYNVIHTARNLLSGVPR